MGAVLSTTGTNCCFSSVLLGYACSVGGIHKLQNRFAFPAPQPTYAITNGSELSFNEPQLADEAAQVCACVRERERGGVSSSLPASH